MTTDRGGLRGGEGSAHEAPAAAGRASAAGGTTRVTILVDNETAEQGLRKEHGLSLWIEHRGRRLLVDTGASTAFLRNARRLGIDIGRADAVALSHGHFDHSGGLAAALEAAPHATLVLHPGAIQPRYLRGGAGRPEAIGMPAGSRTAVTAASRRVHWSDSPIELIPGVWSTGSVPRDAREPGDPDFFFDEACTMPDPVPDDQSFWIDADDGLWVVLGCAHSGVLASLEHVDRLTGSRRVARVLGGTHLMDAGPARARMVAEDLRGRGVRLPAPCHCTGRRAARILRETLGDALLTVGGGSVID